MIKKIVYAFSVLSIIWTASVNAAGLPSGALSVPLKDINSGKTVTLGSFKGKYVYLDFWASWCIPCRASFPFYSQLNSKFSSKGLVMIAVDSEDDMAAAKSFLADTNPNFLTVHDGGKLSGLMNLPKMPTSYILDKQGNVVYTHPGFFPGDESVIEAKLTELLG